MLSKLLLRLKSHFVFFCILAFNCLTLIAFASVMKQNHDIASPDVNFSAANWMSSFSKVLKDKKLNEIVLPGSHDSGTYPITEESKRTDLFLNLGPLNSFVAKIGYRWAKTQDLSISEQLLSGIRYLDFRVFCDELNESFHLVHGFIGSNLVDELHEVFNFVKIYSKEMVIVDMRTLTNCNTYLVNKLLKETSDILKDKLLPPPTDKTNKLPTFGEVSVSGRTILVFLSQSYSSGNYPWVWKREHFLEEPFADTSDIGVLADFIKTKTTEPPNPGSLFVSQTILTPGIQDVLMGLAGSDRGSLREMSIQSNARLFDWLRGLGEDNRLNIVMMDFPDKYLIRKLVLMNAE